MGIGSRRPSFPKGSSQLSFSSAGRSAVQNGAPIGGRPRLARAAEEPEVEIHSNDRIDRNETSVPPPGRTDRDWWRRSDAYPFAVSVCSPVAQTLALGARVEAWFEDRAGPRQFHPGIRFPDCQLEAADALSDGACERAFL